MCGRETLTMLVSRTSMKVGTITAAAISHGFTLMGTSEFMFEVKGVRIFFELIHANVGLNGHSRPEHHAAGSSVVEHNLDRHALHDLDIVACRILRREQAEPRACAGLNAIH